MLLSDLDFVYPEHLIATERQAASRVLLQQGLTTPAILPEVESLLPQFIPGDILVINESKVVPRRVFTERLQLEILFLHSDHDGSEWEVLCPFTKWPSGEKDLLPGGIEIELVERGRPGRVRTSRPLPSTYFYQFGEMPLPPYIQKRRGERHQRTEDSILYQSVWASVEGSLAAPTASLHFTNQHLAQLAKNGIEIHKLTLHIGLGTFLPVQTDRLEDHKMHSEEVEISSATWEAILRCKARKGRIWALGTTVTRALESVPVGKLIRDKNGFRGKTDLFIQPGFAFQVVDVLATNFHQPKSTLLAMVAAFATGGLAQVKQVYNFAIENQFRLFSYGDLSVWIP